MGFVYFVQARSERTLLIKIGHTYQCPYKRLRQLRKEYPYYDSLELLRSESTPTPAKDEKKYQKQFAHLLAMSKRDRDWFRPGPELCEHVKYDAVVHICNPECHKLTTREVLQLQKIEAYDARLTKQKNARLNAFKRALRSEAIAGKPPKAKERDRPLAN